MKKNSSKSTFQLFLGSVLQSTSTSVLMAIKTTRLWSFSRGHRHRNQGMEISPSCPLRLLICSIRDDRLPALRHLNLTENCPPPASLHEHSQDVRQSIFNAMIMP
eukprot:1161387-Pelagomonas_calceolata.AAC.7